jgi:hypothetical protein
VVLFDDLKRCEEAIPRYEEALVIYQRLYNDQHESILLLLPSVSLLPTNSLTTATRSMWTTNAAGATSAGRSRRRWSGALDAAVRQGVPAAALGHAQAAV